MSSRFGDTACPVRASQWLSRCSVLPRCQSSEVPALVCLPAACPPRLLIDVRGRRVLFVHHSALLSLHPSINRQWRAVGRHRVYIDTITTCQYRGIALPALRPSNLVPPSSPVASSSATTDASVTVSNSVIDVIENKGPSHVPCQTMPHRRGTAGIVM